MKSGTSIFDLGPAGQTQKLQRRLSFAPVSKNTAQWPIILATLTVLTTVIAAPMPLGGNHPLAWLFWAALLGAVAAIICATEQRDFRRNFHANRLSPALGMIFGAFALFQAAPLPMLTGGLPVHFPGGTVYLPSLSISPGATLLAAIRTGSYLILFWLALHVGHDLQRARSIATLIFFAIAAYAVLAILSLTLFDDTGIFSKKMAFFGAATGTFINKNSFASFLGIGALLGAALIVDPTALKTRKLNGRGQFHRILAATTIMAALFMTQSRLGIASTLIAGLFVAFPNARLRLSRNVVASALAAVFLTIYGLQNFATLENLHFSLITRLELYKQLLAMIWDRPVSGFGLGSFPLAYEMYHAPPVTANFVWDRGHSTYLTLWVEGGIIFGSLPILAGWFAGRQLYRLSILPTKSSILARAGFGAIILCGLHSLGDFSFEIQANAFLLIAVVGLALGSATKRKDPGHGIR